MKDLMCHERCIGMKDLSAMKDPMTDQLKLVEKLRLKKNEGFLENLRTLGYERSHVI